MTITNATCGAVCWYAKEPECRCSCGGTNHGLLLTDSGAEMPRRNCLILGTRYVLGAMGEYRETQERLRALLEATRETHGKAYTYPGIEGTRYMMPATNARGAIAWNRRASDSQERWPEVEAWMHAHGREVAGGMVLHSPYFLWVREDVAATFDGLPA